MNKKFRMIRTVCAVALACHLSLGSALAQSPHKMSYQAVVRTVNNELATSTNIGMKVSILQATIDGTAVYTETHTAKTNANGLVSVEIGGGVTTTGDFGAIKWSDGPYFVKTEIDPRGGTNYSISGVSQLLSVPYALYAETSGSGVKGETGADGLSAFELWLTQVGNEGKTEADFFASLKGADGTMSFADLTAEQKASLKGDAGVAGKDGLTTSVNGVEQVNGAVTLTKADLGLGQVDNTADLNKPISSATQQALDSKATSATTLAGYGITDAATKAYVDALLRQIEELQIVTGLKPKDIDGNLYKTVTIGAQTWFAENLKTSHYNDGVAIPNVSDQVAWAAQTTGAQCDYNNNLSNTTIYGKLYNWYAAGSGKLCPKGWHVPTNAEWITLLTNLDPLVAANKLKESGNEHWETSYIDAKITNETGFTALPGGSRYSSDFGGIGSYGYWWSSTDYDVDDAYGKQMIYASEDVSHITSNKSIGLSIRCLKD